MKNDLYVYVIFRPDGTPCYVGKGRGGRWKAHLHTCRQRNPHLVAIFAQAGDVLPVVKVREHLTNEEASATEIALIAAIGRETEGGCLVNLTVGGEGAPGFRFSDEARKRMSEQRKGRTHSPEVVARIVAARAGYRHSEATIAKMKMSQSARTRKPLDPNRPKRVFSEQARANMRASKIGFRHTEEAKAKIAAAGRGRKRSAHAIEIVRQALLGKPRTEEVKAKLRAASLGKTHSPETREKCRLAALRRWHPDQG